MTVRIGERMPDVDLVRADRSSTSMDGFRGEATVLIFLRHLG